ncbi:hypothetical protein JOJ86_007269 [Rhodococcus percolatus]|uniref:hypothetical protein n=1 Tax=Rhodococcus opacus TaxID=37919 RepID=UPI0017AE69F7|nr:hypothetical protein [Rhodococcus opacus]MBA8961929.1 hypothetical protein [Rhodococcus opacus]MBP2209543.1 hypothetical protein [Rhodococcus opacus]
MYLAQLRDPANRLGPGELLLNTFDVDENPASVSDIGLGELPPGQRFGKATSCRCKRRRQRGRSEVGVVVAVDQQLFNRTEAVGGLLHEIRVIRID